MVSPPGAGGNPPPQVPPAPKAGAESAKANDASAAAKSPPGEEAAKAETAADTIEMVPPLVETTADTIEVPPPPVETVEVVRYVPNEADVSLRVLLSLIAIGFGVWVVFSWMKYDKTSGQTEQGLHKGSKQMVELTLVKEDRDRLDCASNATFEGVSCGFDAASQPRIPRPADDKILHPYCNIKNDVLLAAGLWQSPRLQGPLPKERFTVMCNYDVVGVLKSVSLRWSPTDKFDAAKQTLPVGILSDCVIPQ